MLAVRFVMRLVLLWVTLLARCCLRMLFAALGALVMCLFGGWVLLFLVVHVWALRYFGLPLGLVFVWLAVAMRVCLCLFI